MPRKRVPCPSCGDPKSAVAKLCKKCTTPYKRTPEIIARMKKSLSQVPHTWIIGTKRPDVGKKISKAWTPEMREAARIRGLLNAENREWLVKIAISLSGENNPNYQGKGKESPYAPGWGRGYRDKIRNRANGECELCEKKVGCLDLHHADFSKTNHAPDNLMVICRSCHKRLHFANSVKT